MNIVNLHIHEVVVYPNERVSPIHFAPQGPIQTRAKVENVTPNGFIKRGYWSHTRGLPDPQPETIYIVSSLTAMFELYENGRTDLVFPWGLIRNEERKTIACRSLCQPIRRP